jgi:nucleotide-binding universal stress UspA family protein
MKTLLSSGHVAAGRGVALIVVVGSHGHSPGGRIILGSVGACIAAIADRSVMIVR